ncbi:Proteasome subunit alpha type-1 [Toxocara canis]|uniref:Proteasome subunit alpha type-1 n=1 Tax=Toxocara canis TaxID=6265 RepID=A0A0B2UQ72_TOXCA|nr:Proteasome subunit alpha type-1 [Toxocara canis]
MDVALSVWDSLLPERGAHVVKTDPSAEVVETLASSIGARSQSARTFLERHLDEFPNANIDQLVELALLALRDTLPAEDNLSKKVCITE